MKTATGLVLIAIGAVLAFAVHGHPWFLNIQVVGWILMIIGVVGMAIPRSGYGWLRRQVVTRRGPGGRQVVGVSQKRYPDYIAINPAAASIAESSGAAPAQSAPADDDAVEGVPVSAPEQVVTTRTAESPGPGPDEPLPDEQVVEDYFQE